MPFLTRGHRQPPASEHPGTVVIVDDDPVVLRSLAHLLTYTSHVVETCTTAEEVIEHVRAGHVRVVVSDISMPVVSGIELLRAIHANDPDLPVILVTGQPTLETAREAIEYGAFRYFVKPINPPEFVRTVERAARLYPVAQTMREAIAYCNDGLTGIADIGDRIPAAEFERALAHVRVAFQPIVRAADLSVFGYEALLRFDEPFLSAQPVVQLAERLGEVSRLGNVIRELAANSMLEKQCPRALFLNVHPQELLDPGFLDEGTSLTAIADRVILEITERAAIGRIEDVRAAVRELRARGFRIAIDDLGVGYAGLSSFALLEPEFVKLDVTLIHDIDSSTTKQRLVKSLVSLCRDVGLSVVAEGVETRAEADTVIGLGCDLLQGFLFAHPGPAFPPVHNG